MAENNSKDLLQLESNSAAVSSCLGDGILSSSAFFSRFFCELSSKGAAFANFAESKLFVCKKDQPFSLPGAPLERPAMVPIPKSQVLGKVKDFLGVISESNKKLLQEAKDNPENYDIEVLSGKESEVIEMDLMLGVADLHTPEAVAAAESAIAGYQPTMPLSESSSGSENEDSSNEDDDNNEDNISEQDNNAASDCVKLESKNAKRDSSRETLKKRKPKKRTKIIELI
ncbi:UNVERIFIED_CONTAM: hypothetical protein Sangu_2640800 [Sesamum angustifolium]|uniref:Uncharacterized protein n=1 Tax=Sesamum angustifolium TaxID=2727405 RepID=A0AAW2J2Y5_9LAMI